MTKRTLRPTELTQRRDPDFCNISNAEAVRRVQLLVRMGLPEELVGSLYGWGANDVRRALADRASQS
jgi:hypothetical protein